MMTELCVLPCQRAGKSHRAEMGHALLSLRVVPRRGTSRQSRLTLSSRLARLIGGPHPGPGGEIGVEGRRPGSRSESDSFRAPCTLFPDTPRAHGSLRILRAKAEAPPVQRLSGQPVQPGGARASAIVPGSLIHESPSMTSNFEFENDRTGGCDSSSFALLLHDFGSLTHSRGCACSRST